MSAPAIPESLPVLVQRAAAQLASATTAAEVLEARDLAATAYAMAKTATRLATAKGAHDELIAKAHRAQADALIIEAQAKRRLADEYDAAQERGEVQTRGGSGNSRTELPTAAEAGLTRKDIYEARQIRDAELASPGVVTQAIGEALAEGREPTKALVRRAVVTPRKRTKPKAAQQLANLRKAWREASPAVRDHFLTELRGQRGVEEWET